MTNDALKRIYNESFPNEKDFCDKLFKICGENVRTLEIEKNPVSILFLLDTVIYSNEKQYKSAYVFAVATDKKYRQKGYMSKLIEKIKQEDYDVLFLKPSNNSLVEFYKKSGFIKFTANYDDNKNLFAEPINSFKTMSENEEINIHKNYTMMYFSNKNLNLNGLSFKFTME